MSDVDIADAAVKKATGADWATWMERLQPHHDLDHTARVKALVAQWPDVDLWWAQMVIVEYERRHGLRVVGQTCAGDFQVSCSKTMPWDAAECLERIVTTPFLPGADWTEGAVWEADGAKVQVRRVDEKVVRWFWFDDDGKSTVTVGTWPSKTGDKTQITFHHSELASLEAREHYRAKWKAALAMICNA